MLAEALQFRPFRSFFPGCVLCGCADFEPSAVYLVAIDRQPWRAFVAASVECRATFVPFTETFYGTLKTTVVNDAMAVAQSTRSGSVRVSGRRRHRRSGHFRGSVHRSSDELCWSKDRKECDMWTWSSWLERELVCFFHFSVSLAAFRPRPCRWFCTSAQVLRSRPNRIQPAWLLFDRVGVGKEWANFFPWKDFSPDYFLDVSRVQRVEMKFMNVSISNMSEAS